MKYTKRQRHRIYVKALKRLPNQYWLCWALSIGRHVADLNDFPEVLKQKPKRLFNSDSWFSNGEFGMKKRAAILRNAIKETK